MIIDDTLKNSLDNFKLIFKRFPLAIISSILLSSVYAIGTIKSGGGIMASRSSMSLLLERVIFIAVFMFIFIALLNSFLESIFKKSYYKFITNIVGIAFIIGLFFITRRQEHVYGTKIYLIHSGIVIFFILSSLYIEILNNPKSLDVYLYRIIRSFCISMYCSIIILIGTILIAYIIISLFFEPTWAPYDIACFVIMNTVNLFIFLNFFPKAKKYEEYNIPNYIELIVGVIVPIVITIFGIILYFRSIVDLIQKKISMETTNYFIIFYCILAILNLMMFRLKKSNREINLYSKILPITMIPLVGLLFFSIWTKIKDFGVIENRYFLIIIGIWILFSAIYFIFNKYKNNIPIIIMASILVLISSIGPASAYNISLNSQEKRLEHYLSKNNMIKDGKIISNNITSMEDIREIRNILFYFYGIDNWFNKDIKDIDLIYNTDKKFYENTLKYFGFDIFYYDPDLTVEENHVQRYIEFGDEYFKIENIEEFKNSIEISIPGDSVDGYYIDVENNNLFVEKNGDKKYISFEDIEKKLLERNNDYTIDFDLIIDGKDIKVAIRSLYVQFGNTRLDAKIKIFEK